MDEQDAPIKEGDTVSMFLIGTVNSMDKESIEFLVPATERKFQLIKVLVEKVVISKD